MVVGQEGGYIWGGGLLVFWGGYFCLFIGNFDLQPCGLQRNTRTVSSGPFQHSSWSLWWILARKSLNPVLVIQWYKLITSLGWDWEGGSHFIPFLAAIDGALPVRSQGLECPGSAALGSAPGLFLQSVQFLFLPCLFLAEGGPEPKTETCSSLGCFSFLLLTSRYFFFQFQNTSSIHSPIIVVSRGFAFCISKWRQISLSGFSLILNAAFKDFNSVLFQWYAMWLCCSLGENVFHIAFRNGLLQSK